jgi:hypothetical protein
VKVQTTVSKLASAKGRLSASPAAISTSKPSGRGAASAMARSSADGSTPMTLVTVAGS